MRRELETETSRGLLQRSWLMAGYLDEAVAAKVTGVCESKAAGRTRQQVGSGK